MAVTPYESHQREELAWSGGLFSGEGYFSASAGNPRAGINLTELDVLDRFRAAIGFGPIYGPYLNGSHKPRWTWQVNGCDRVQTVLDLLWPWLNQRRRSRATEILAAAADRTQRLRISRQHCMKGHLLEGEHLLIRKDGRRSCRTCQHEYSRAWRLRKAAEVAA